VFPLVDDDAAIIRAEVPLPVADPRSQFVRVDDVLVDLKERDVVIEDLVQQDHELHEVRARLLPERLLPTPKQVGHQGGDPIGQRVGVEIVVERVVPIRRVETDFDVVVLPPVLLEDVAHLPAEVTFDLEHEAGRFARGIIARYAKTWSTYGYMQADVLPDPMASTTKIPVYKPRSGMVSHEGCAARAGDVR
jgi:hypothetical protein